MVSNDFFCTYSNLRGPEETRGKSSFPSSSPLHAQQFELTMSPSHLSHYAMSANSFTTTPSALSPYGLEVIIYSASLLAIMSLRQINSHISKMFAFFNFNISWEHFAVESHTYNSDYHYHIITMSFGCSSQYKILKYLDRDSTHDSWGLV